MVMQRAQVPGPILYTTLSHSCACSGEEKENEKKLYVICLYSCTALMWYWAFEHGEMCTTLDELSEHVELERQCCTKGLFCLRILNLRVNYLHHHKLELGYAL